MVGFLKTRRKGKGKLPDWGKKLLKNVGRFDNSYEGLTFLLDQFTLNLSSPFTNREVHLLS